jgi:hypothetical protein
MPALSVRRMAAFLHTARTGANTVVRGRAFEDLLCYIFGRVPGIGITKRDQLNTFESEEIDVALWNDKKPGAFDFLPNIILLEAKNWRNPAGSAEVSWFDTKLRNRGLDHGIFVALNGITGDAGQKNAAHHVIAASLMDHRRLVVLTGADITPLRSTNELVTLIKTKLCELAVSGTVIP